MSRVMVRNAHGSRAGLGRRIFRLRHRRGLTLDALGKRARLTRGFLSQLEHGTSRPSLDSLYRLAQALRTSPGRLLGAVSR